MKVRILTLAVVSLLAAACSDSLGDASSTDDSNDALTLGVDKLGAEPTGRPTRYPIVLVSGILTTPKGGTGFIGNGVQAALQKDGHKVYVPKVPVFDSTEVRAQALAQAIGQILSETKADKINLIGHSSGGTDARAVVNMQTTVQTANGPQTVDIGDHIASITTVSSAHHGSPLADLALREIDAGSDAINAFVSYFGFSQDTISNNNSLRNGFLSIAESNAASFNAANPVDSRVYYQSWAGIANTGSWDVVPGLSRDVSDNDDAACENKRYGDVRVNGAVHPALTPLWAMINHLQKNADGSPAANDGMVPVESAKWGEFRGCVPGDHMTEISGYKLDSMVSTGFDHLRFYRTIAFELQAKHNF